MAAVHFSNGKDDDEPEEKEYRETIKQKKVSAAISHLATTIGQKSVKKAFSARDRFTLPTKQMKQIKKLKKDALGLGKYFDDDENPTTFRGKVRALLNHSSFESVMGFFICANVALMVFQTNVKVQEERDPEFEGPLWQDILEYIFLVVYTVELSLRYIGYGYHAFRNRWIWADSLIVFLSYLDIIITEVTKNSAATEGAPPVTVLRIFRIFRLLRVLRILRFQQELRQMVQGFIGAMLAMFWGGVMILILLLLLGILAVELVYPKKSPGWDEYCWLAFQSVETCMLMFFQTLLAGDSWGRCAIPVIKENPYFLVIFASALVSITLGFTNLILAVIVEHAARHSELEAADKLSALEKKREEAAQRVKHAIEAIDQDGSGTISISELMNGYAHNSELRNLFTLLGIQQDDLSFLFALIEDENKEASYDDFVRNLRTVESQGLNTQVMMISLALGKLRRRVSKLSESGKLTLLMDQPESANSATSNEPSQVRSLHENKSSNS